MAAEWMDSEQFSILPILDYHLQLKFLSFNDLRELH